MHPPGDGDNLGTLSVNRLRLLHEAGQSIWADFLRRSLITGGGLERLLWDNAVTGVTSNPTIFGRAIAGSTDYDEAIRVLAGKGRRDPSDVFYDLALADIGMAADVFRPLYEATPGGDGFVSFELEPGLADDAEGSVAAARELAERIGKPNVMIKVPGTPAGIRAVEELTASGVNVNITLLFSVTTYEQVARAYLAGLERRLQAGKPLDVVNSVASFFVSRVDSAVDPLLPEHSPLRGKVAIANAKQAYRRFRRLFSGRRWERLAEAGAHLQRPLWASTGTKNPAYSDVLYVEELIGPDTVNTMPEATLDAFRGHGRVRPLAILEGLEEAEAVLLLLHEHGIDLEAIAGRLLTEGLATFEKDFANLLLALDAKLEAASDFDGPHRTSSLGTLERRVVQQIEQAERDELVGRIWSRDHTVWHPLPAEIVDRLGWLDLPERMPDQIANLQAFADEVQEGGFTDVLLLGMGGSSLAAEVYRDLFPAGPGAVRLTVLDTIHPAAIAKVERALDLEQTLFVIASKSGATIETLAHYAYFCALVGRSDQFVAITDPGTPLEELAQQRGFWEVFLNPPDVGGRYSALSLFGLLPAALTSADLPNVVEGSAEMAAACNRCVPCIDNPGLWLGVVIGEAVRAGRDKLTLVTAPEAAAFGPWVEQLLAESTGKDGTGVVPVIDEDLAIPGRYSADRLFVVLGDHPATAELEAAGHPVVRLDPLSPARLGAEFFRWEFATAVAGHVLGVNPFNEPNVAEAKEATRQILEDGPIDHPGRDDLDTLLRRIQCGDYIALQAFLDPTEEVIGRLQRARLALRDRHRVATTLGFGPRYLHSTGQLHKGGPDRGVFLQIVDETREIDLPIPGRPFTFGDLLDAQALADLTSLRTRGRRVARATLSQLEETVS
ncbi:MAG: bifunctional transaldolase/phosoglucose isomerase [Actinomycetota bacterium]